MITLHGFGPAFGLPDPSPFVAKVMALLKIADLPFELKASDPRKGPKGKMPWIVDGERTIADSTFIQRYLEEQYSIDFYPALSGRERAMAWSVEKMCEDHLYFCLVHERWAKDANFQKGPRTYFDDVPSVIRPLVLWQVRRHVMGQVMSQGMGGHSDAEIVALAARDFAALSALMGEKDFVFDNGPTATDAVVHSFVAGALVPFFDGPLRKAALAHDNLVSYEQRLTQRWYPEMPA